MIRLRLSPASLGSPLVAPTLVLAASLKPVKVQVFRLWGQPQRGLVEAHRVHGPLPGDSEAPRFAQAASLLSERPVPSCLSSGSSGSSLPVSQAWWEELPVGQWRCKLSTCQMVISRELWDDFSRSVFTRVRSLQEEAGSMEAMTREGREVSPATVPPAGRLPPWPCRRRRQDEAHCPLHLSSSGASAALCPVGAHQAPGSLSM